ncbi:MAG TPA: hypothetical protein VGF94_23420 [Kofleriaceae bacterium]|jgi:hypothetical protein
MRTWLVVVAALEACGNSTNPSNKIMLVPDAPVDSAPPTEVMLFAPETPQFIAYRDGQGAWQTPPSDGQGNYTLEVTNDYQWMIVCAADGSFDAILDGATVADGTQFAFCFAGGGGSGATVTVEGSMVQPGTLDVGGATASGTTGDWNYDVQIPPGTHDVVWFDADKMLVDRSEVLTSDVVYGPVDFSTEGTAMTPVTLTVGNLGSDTLGIELDWFLTNDVALFFGSSTMLETPPSSLLVLQDFEFLDVTASSPTTFRDASTEFHGVETSFTLLDPLTGITFAASNGVASATWGTLPSYDALTLFVDGPTGTQEVSASQSWIAATGATQLAFEQMPPGYDSAWQVDLTGPYVRELSLDASSGTTTLDTAVVDEVNGPLVRRPHSRAALRRAREARRRSAAR